MYPLLKDIVHFVVNNLFNCVYTVSGTPFVALFLRRSSSAAVKKCLKFSKVCSSSDFFLHSLQSSWNKPVFAIISYPFLTSCESWIVSPPFEANCWPSVSCS